MLEKDPLKRLSAAECLSHPFFNDSEKDALELVSEDDPNLEAIHAAEISKLKDK
jgi:serine/threonine protein kinase